MRASRLLASDLIFSVMFSPANYEAPLVQFTAASSYRRSCDRFYAQNAYMMERSHEKGGHVLSFPRRPRRSPDQFYRHWRFSSDELDRSKRDNRIGGITEQAGSQGGPGRSYTARNGSCCRILVGKVTPRLAQNPPRDLH